jgi:hypothetical protein
MNEIGYQKAPPPFSPRMLRNKELRDFFLLVFLGKWSLGYSDGLGIWVGCCGHGMLTQFLSRNLTKVHWKQSVWRHGHFKNWKWIKLAHDRQI